MCVLFIAWSAVIPKWWKNFSGKYKKFFRGKFLKTIFFRKYNKFFLGEFFCFLSLRLKTAPGSCIFCYSPMFVIDQMIIWYMIRSLVLLEKLWKVSDQTWSKKHHQIQSRRWWLQLVFQKVLKGGETQKALRFLIEKAWRERLRKTKKPITINYWKPCSQKHSYQNLHQEPSRESSTVWVNTG